MPELIKREIKFDGPMFRVSRDTWGSQPPLVRDVVHHNGSVAMCVIEDNDVDFNKAEIYLVRQYRYGVEDWCLELPAGTIDPEEDSSDALVRECEEELGLKPHSYQLLQEIYPSPGFLSERIWLYRVNIWEKTEQRLDVGEELDIVKITIGEVKDMIQAGAIKDAKTIVGVMLL